MKLVILGGGESGTGAAILGKKQGWEVFLSDKSPLKDTYKAELSQAAIRWEEGQHTESEKRPRRKVSRLSPRSSSPPAIPRPRLSPSPVAMGRQPPPASSITCYNRQASP